MDALTIIPEEPAAPKHHALLMPRPSPLRKQGIHKPRKANILKDEEDEKTERPKVPDGGRGWAVVFAAFVIETCGFGGFSRAAGVFYAALTEEFSATELELAFIGVSLATLGLCLVCLGVWDLCSCCCRSGRSDTSVPPGELHPVGDVSPMPSPPPAYSSLFTFRPSVTSVTGNVPDMCVPSSSANPDNVILLPVTYIRCEDRRGSHHLTCSCASPTPSMDDRPPKYEDAFCD
uniref:Uncharacterized protein n=1 Tax=Branchiostoma floridae TaxID=7739 RepID=C3Y228_BRAFL|eukprot:XP_002609908.1 hypothetical protein BRAFLDRAFT_90709 [Branchiostoma floridae]